MGKLTLDDLSLVGKKVLIRVDFNVPITETGEVRDFFRIRAALPTIHNVLDYGGATILMSHLGRPKGEWNMKYSLKPVATELSNRLGLPVKFAPDCVGEDVRRMVKDLKMGEILLLENLRFYNEETTNDTEFAAELAKNGDLFVNDAFGAAHREHASIHAITNHFPEKSAAGRLMMRERRFLGRALTSLARPFVGVVGGAKVSSKIKTIKRLLQKVDILLIGGGMTYTLIKAKGGKIGSSLFESDYMDEAHAILNSKDANKLRLPKDSICARKISVVEERKEYASDDIPDDWMGLDIGLKAKKQFSTVIKSAKTVLWNGPMGFFEMDPFATGTRTVARAMIDMTSKGGKSIVGGGDSAAALHKFHMTGPMSHVSTGGGSLLEFMEEKPLPGWEALTDVAIPIIKDSRKRDIIIAGNWKMNTTPEEGAELARKITNSVTSSSRRMEDFPIKVITILCPPATHHPLVSSAISGVDIEMGAQNVHWEDKGAFTAELSAEMLLACGCTYAIIGHSERRQYFGETDETVNKRLLKSLEAGLVPIVCIGETEDERESGKTFEILRSQIKAGLQNVNLASNKLILAYEPVWAVGTGKTATPELAQEAHSFIRQEIAAISDKNIASKISILYGGSVNDKNADGLLSQPDIDGALIGGVSLHADKFVSVIDTANRIISS